MKKNQKTSKLKMFLHLNLIAVFFIFILVIRKIALSSGFNIETAGGRVLFSAVVNALKSPGLIVDLAFFFASAILAHLMLASLWFFIWQPISFRIKLESKQKYQLSILSFFPVLAWILLINNYFHPKSEFAIFSSDDTLLLNTLIIIASSYLLLVLLVSLALISKSIFYYFSSNKFLNNFRAQYAFKIIAIFALISSSSLVYSLKFDNKARANPDIILIGVDSLRIDHVGFFTDKILVSLTPNIDNLLADSAVVQNAWTPLARTFPAWISILTGQYPSSHGGFFNLMPRHLVNDIDSLSHQLGSLDYQRVFAIDETRFSNIDESYGFEKIIAPKIGAADFLLGLYHDFPIINLFSNTQLGRIFFPYLYMNRALASIYQPEQFDLELQKTLNKLDNQKPLFLAVHFELPHWPFVWHSSEKLIDQMPLDFFELSPTSYQAAISKTDQQVGALIQALKNSGRLDNAILVLLSDHGEAFTWSEPFWNCGFEPGVVMNGGHGTNVMSEAQYRVLLSFRGYGVQKERILSGVFSDATASLVDIRPTLSEWLNLSQLNNSNIEGVSLLPLLRGEFSEKLKNRVVFLETGFNPPSLMVQDSELNLAQIAQESEPYYNIQQNGRMALKESMLSDLLIQKQRAVVSGNWLLAAFPKQVQDYNPSWDLFLGNWKKNTLWNISENSSLPENVPVSSFLDRLCLSFKLQNAVITNQCKKNSY